MESLQKQVRHLPPKNRIILNNCRQAQSSLMEHNEKINQLLGQIDIVKETEEKQQEILKNNEELCQQIDELKFHACTERKRNQ